MAEIRNDNYKPESGQKKAVTTGKVKEKTFWQKVRDSFIAEEVHDVKSYVVFDIVIPAIKHTFRNLVMNTLDMSLFGKPMGGATKGDQRGGSTYIAYERAYGGSQSGGYGGGYEKKPRGNAVTVGIRELDRVIFNDKSDAIDVLSYLFDNIEGYGIASVADFLSAANVEITPINHKWGWSDLRGASVEECPDGSGFYIRFPKPRPI